MPITAAVDPGQKRTSQRAELLAALAGLRFLSGAYEANHSDSDKDSDEIDNPWVITTDSEYVVEGMTEWLPTWKMSKSLCSSVQSVID